MRPSELEAAAVLMELMASAGKKWPERVQVLNQMVGGDYIPAEPKRLSTPRTIDEVIPHWEDASNYHTATSLSRRALNDPVSDYFKLTIDDVHADPVDGSQENVGNTRAIERGGRAPCADRVPF
jgi:hypothetical protein